MVSKAVVALFVCQLALSLALPALVEEKTTLLKEGQGQEDVQKLIDELVNTHQSGTNKEKVVKKTTITTVEEPKETLSDSEQLRTFLQNPEFVKKFKEFLTQFMNMFLSLNRLQQGSNTSTKVVTEEEMDLQSLMKNPSFFNFLSNFFSSSSQGGGLNEFLLQLFNQNKRPSVTTTTTTETVEEQLNGHSRPAVERPSQVTITRVEDETNVDKESNPAEEMINKLTEDRPKTTSTTTVVEESVVKTPEVNDRFSNNDNSVTITHIGDSSHMHENNVVSTSEELLNELKRHSNNEHTVEKHITEEIVRPAVVVHKVPTTTTHEEDWSNVHSSSSSSKVENSAEALRQAKNAHYQYATQINDEINGNFQQKAEIRQNGILYGKYSYDDGYSWRTVYYQADSNGFRVTKEEVVPSHMKHLTGNAEVQTLMDGNLIDYHITEKDIGSTKRTKVTKFE